MVKVALVVTHPIQYYVPVFQALAQRGKIRVKVFYTWGEQSVRKFDPGFGKVIEWDLPLLEGYEYEFLQNRSAEPGSHHFKGIDNPEIVERIDAFAPDKILVFGWSYRSHLKVLRHYKGKVPIYFRGDSHQLNAGSGLRAVLRRLYLTWVYRHIDYAISVGANNRAYYLHNGLKPSQVLFAPHAVDEQRFEDPNGTYKAQADTLKKELGIPQDDIVVLYAGKFEPVKNLGFLLDAFTLAGTPGLSLLLIGNGEEEQMLKARQIPKVFFMDFQNQRMMPVIYRMGDIFVLASKSETWGLAVNEAMNCGCALLLHERIGSAKDLLQEGYNGFYFRQGDVNDLAEQMKRIASIPERLEFMKENSKVLVAQWSYQSLVQGLEDILSS
jgi:glycosyltransferase involved in cell wall biosynthesis